MARGGAGGGGGGGGGGGKEEGGSGKWLGVWKCGWVHNHMQEH